MLMGCSWMISPFLDSSSYRQHCLDDPPTCSQRQGGDHLLYVLRSTGTVVTVLSGGATDTLPVEHAFQ